MNRSNRTDHIRLTSHPEPGAKLQFPIKWGAPTARERGPIIGTVSRPQDRNVIGSHGGSYAVYRALAVSAGALDPIRRPDLTNTFPAATIGPVPQWTDPQRIVSLDPWGHLVAESFKTEIAEGIDIRPTIAITRARLDLPEMQSALAAGRLKNDGSVVHQNGSVSVVKIAIDPVWYLPGIAARFGTTEQDLRRALFEQTAGMFPELVTRPDLQVFLPPIGGTTIYLFGDVAKLADPRTQITCRVHDECNGSDVFGSDICTCRPYLIHGIEECARSGQAGGLGIIIYNRKEGRALGEVTKFLVYNARKRQEGGDAAAQYFERTECVAGVQDARFQQLMPDAVNWLGIKRIDRFVSMSDMKYDALVSQGIDIVERVAIPDELVPADAHVEIEAKKAAGYFTPQPQKPQDVTDAVGRDLNKY
jgi:GTP cyclohydrolase II